MTATATHDGQPVHEYRELRDTVYPHLVNAQCTCGWRIYVAGLFAFSFFAKHATAAGARHSQEDSH